MLISSALLRAICTCLYMNTYPWGKNTCDFIIHKQIISTHTHMHTYMRVRVCLCGFIYICMYIMHVCVDAYMYVRIHIYKKRCMYVCLHVCMYVHACVHVCIRERVYVCVCVLVCVLMCVRVEFTCVCVYMCMRVFAIAPHKCSFQWLLYEDHV